jgi:hypothetical protein
MWEALQGRADIYFIDLNSGKRELVKQWVQGQDATLPFWQVSLLVYCSRQLVVYNEHC